MTIRKRRIVGRFWYYKGNSVNGRNSQRRTPKGYDLETVERVAAIADDCEVGQHYGRLADLVTEEEAAQIDIIYHNGDNFGQEITVKAPKSVWDKANDFWPWE